MIHVLDPGSDVTGVLCMLLVASVADCSGCFSGTCEDTVCMFLETSKTAKTFQEGSEKILSGRLTWFLTRSVRMPGLSVVIYTETSWKWLSFVCGLLRREALNSHENE